jgi:Ca2+-binding RTX toxin-like protein
LIGTSISNKLSGGSGNDNIDGGAGNDTLIGGDGIDSMSGGDGIDIVDYSDVSGIWVINLLTDTAIYGSITETIATIENVIGSKGNDTITGDTTANLLSGYNGNDLLIGGSGNDTLSGGLGRDSFDGGSGTDLVDYTDSGVGFNWTLSLASNTANNNAGITETFIAIESLIGSSGNDSIVGNTAANTLKGGDGNDTIDGGEGKDTLSGGEGADSFRFSLLADSPDAMTDMIADFVTGVDKIILTGLGFTGLDTDGGRTESGELKLAYSASTNRTYVCSEQIDFEFYLDGGDYSATVTNEDFIW